MERGCFKYIYMYIFYVILFTLVIVVNLLQYHFFFELSFVTTNILKLFLFIFFTITFFSHKIFYFNSRCRSFIPFSFQGWRFRFIFLYLNYLSFFTIKKYALHIYVLVFTFLSIHSAQYV